MPPKEAGARATKAALTGEAGRAGGKAVGPLQGPGRPALAAASLCLRAPHAAGGQTPSPGR